MKICRTTQRISLLASYPNCDRWIFCCRFLYTNAPRPTKQTAAITPTAIPAFFPPVIPPPDDSFDDSALSWLISLATSEFGAGAGAEDGDCFDVALPGDGAGDESGDRSDGGGAGGEVRFDEGDGAGLTGG